MKKISGAAFAAAVALSSIAIGQPALASGISDGVVKIGVLNDQSGPYVDLAGPGSVLAAEMAKEDFGGKVLGMPIEIVSGDHQNKPDVGSAIVRAWIDKEGVDAIADVPTSSVAMAVQGIVREKDRIFLISGAATEALSRDACSPNSIQTSDDTYALTHGTIRAAVESGADTWFFITADYTFGNTIETASRAIIEEAGGKVLGSVKHPQGTTDFSSYLLQAQASGAKAIGLANAGNDTITAIKQAGEFGLHAGGQQLVGLILFISEINALGLDAAQGLLLTEGFYWDMNDQAREWSDRFEKRFGKKPTREHATTYATVMHYLKAIEKAGTDNAADVMKQLKGNPMEFFGTTGQIREDGRFIHDLALYQVKSPEESKGPWDFYKKVRDIPGEKAFVPLAESNCPLVKTN